MAHAPRPIQSSMRTRTTTVTTIHDFMMLNPLRPSAASSGRSSRPCWFSARRSAPPDPCRRLARHTAAFYPVITHESTIRRSTSTTPAWTPVLGRTVSDHALGAAQPTEQDSFMTTSPRSSTPVRTRRRTATLPILFAAAGLVLASLSPTQSVGAPDSRSGAARPTIVLVHGAWADASSWNKVTAMLQADGYTVRAIPNTLRSLATDAASVRAFLATLTGPIVVVGHSYGGAVITNAATGNPNVKALVYVNGQAPDEGQTAFDSAGPDSALAVSDPTTVFDFVPAGPPTPDTDLYLKSSAVFDSFAPGLSAQDKAIVFATQRPARFGGLTEASGVPAWKTIPSWYLIGTKDKIIPPSAQRVMAARAGSTVTEYNAGHLGLMSDPRIVTQVIERKGSEGERQRPLRAQTSPSGQGVEPARLGALSCVGSLSHLKAGPAQRCVGALASLDNSVAAGPMNRCRLRHRTFTCSTGPSVLSGWNRDVTSATVPRARGTSSVP